MDSLISRPVYAILKAVRAEKNIVVIDSENLLDISCVQFLKYLILCKAFPYFTRLL